MYAHRSLACTACRARLRRDVTTCPGCGATIRELLTERELTAIRHAEIEKRAAEMEYDECDDCKPEVPCEKHKAQMTFEEFAATRDDS
jgi:hypothetical protein